MDIPFGRLPRPLQASIRNEVLSAVVGRGPMGLVEISDASGISGALLEAALSSLVGQERLRLVGASTWEATAEGEIRATQLRAREAANG